MSDRTSTLLAIVEPLFQSICSINRRLKRAKGELDKFVLRDELKAQIAELERAIREAGMEHLAPEVKRDLVCFIDCMMRTMPGELGSNWEMGPSETQRSLSEEIYEDRAFETTFIERAQEALETYRARPDEDTRARLSLYYIFLGLGCQGAYEGQLPQLESLANQIAAALGDLVRSPGTRLCLDAYKHTDRRAPIDGRVAVSRTVVLIVAGVLLVVVLIGHLLLYRMAAGDMRGAIAQITSEATP